MMEGGDYTMDDQKRRGMSPIAAGITGLILGVAGTVGIALVDENNRKKALKNVKKIRDDLSKWSDRTLHELQQKSYDVRKDLAAKLNPHNRGEGHHDLSEEKKETRDELLHN